MTSYSLVDAARILKVRPSRLRYWERTKLVQHASAPEQAEGFDFKDLVCVKGVLALLEQGISLQRIRRSVEDLRAHAPELDDPLASLRLWSEGSGRVVVRHEGTVFEPSGQMLLDFRAEGPESEEVAPLEGGAAPAQLATARSSALEWFERGCLLDSSADSYADAIEAYQKSLELDPNFADAHCNLGAVLYNQGDKASAQACFERCLALVPTHVEAHFNLANLLEERGSNEEALRHYRVAVELDPFCTDLHINLALLYEKLGLGSKGRAHWKRYLQLDPGGAWAEVAKMRLGLED